MPPLVETRPELALGARLPPVIGKLNWVTFEFLAGAIGLIPLELSTPFSVNFLNAAVAPSNVASPWPRIVTVWGTVVLNSLLITRWLIRLAPWRPSLFEIRFAAFWVRVSWLALIRAPKPSRPAVGVPKVPSC